MIRVQREDFDVGAELQRLAAGHPRIGGVASFIGLVRDMGGNDRVSALTLEHYPGMTEKKLGEIETEAHDNFVQFLALRCLLGANRSQHAQNEIGSLVPH